MVAATVVLLLFSLYFFGGMMLDLQAAHSDERWFERLEKGILGVGSLCVLVVLWCPIDWVQLLFALFGMLSLSPVGPVLYYILLSATENDKQ